MKIIRIVIFLIFSGSLHSQDTIDNKKKNFLVINCDYLYNEYLGNRTVQFYPGASATAYYSSTAENTSGLLVSAGYRHYLHNLFSIQAGVDFRYKTSRYLHDDSIVNSNNSSLKRQKISYNRLEFPIYCGFHIKRFSLLSGIIIPLVSLGYTTSYYEDGSTAKLYYGREWGEFYLSEKLQCNLFKKQNIGISVGGDFSTDIFKKYSNGYLINWNIGVQWILERKKKIKEEDYVQ